MTPIDPILATRRVADVMARATPRQVAQGVAWYRDTFDVAAAMAGAHYATLPMAIGTIAALSPGVPYSRSLELADDMLSTGDCAHPYGDSIRKARAIVTEPDRHPLDILRGRKVRSFYDNIWRPLTSREVTIDRHAYAIVLGVQPSGPRGGRPVNYNDLARPGRYDAVADAYRGVADECGLTPSQVQAITWVVWRGAAR